MSSRNDIRNRPGSWNCFLSHVQAETRDIALDAFYLFRDKHGLTSWLDVKMEDKSEAAMEEGVRCSERVVVIVSETYFSRPFCLKELRCTM